MTPIPKVPRKKTTFRQTFNYNNASEAEKLAALNANQAKLSQDSVNIANRLADNVGSFGAAAAAGGGFMDTSVAPGFQSPVTGQFTGMLERGVENPILARNKSVLDIIRLRNKKQYKNALNKNPAAGGVSALINAGLMSGTEQRPVDII